MFAGISGCIGMLVAGVVTKFMEPRYVFQIAYIITGSTVLLLTIKHDFNFLTALSFVFGFAQGSGTTTSNIIFLTLVNKNRRAVAFGWANFMTSLAIVVAPPFAGNFSLSLLVFIEEIKRRAKCIVELYKHAGIFKNTREVRETLAFGSCFSALLSCS